MDPGVDEAAVAAVTRHQANAEMSLRHRRYRVYPY